MIRTSEAQVGAEAGRLPPDSPETAARPFARRRLAGRPWTPDGDSSAIAALRYAGPVVVVLIIVWMSAAAPRPVALRWIVLGGAALFFASAWMPGFARRFRLWTLLFCTFEMAVVIGVSAFDADPVARFFTIILSVFATIALVRFDSRWQAAMGAIAIVAFALATSLIPISDPYLAERWLAVIATVALSELAAIFIERRERMIAREFGRVIRSAEASERLVSTLVHDIRNPIASVSGFINLLCEECIDDSQRAAMLMRIGAAVRGIDLLVGNILDLHVIDSGGLVAHKKTLDPNVIVREIVAEAAAVARQRGVDIHAECGPAPYVDADPRHLERIVKNLLAYAVDRSTQGEINVTTGSREGRASVVLSDAGATMDIASVGRLMSRPSYSAGEPLPAEAGLFVARSLAEANGGHIIASSGLGQGLRITLEFPASASGS